MLWGLAIANTHADLPSGANRVTAGFAGAFTQHTPEGTWTRILQIHLFHRLNPMVGFALLYYISIPKRFKMKRERGR